MHADASTGTVATWLVPTSMVRKACTPMECVAGRARYVLCCASVPKWIVDGTALHVLVLSGLTGVMGVDIQAEVERRDDVVEWAIGAAW